MSEQIREQVSAFLDGELPNSETELLLKRLTRDGELRESFGRYALIGEALRGASPTLLTMNFTGRVNLAIDGEPVPAGAQGAEARFPRWWRPLAGLGVAACVALVAIVALQNRALSPVPGVGVSLTAQSSAPGPGALPAQGSAQSTLTAQGPLTAQAPREAISYTVPVPSPAAPAAMPQARLTNYVFAHSRYSSGLDQRGVMADLLIEAEEQQPAANEPAARAAP